MKYKYQKGEHELVRYYVAADSVVMPTKEQKEKLSIARYRNDP